MNNNNNNSSEADFGRKMWKNGDIVVRLATSQQTEIIGYVIKLKKKHQSVGLEEYVQPFGNDVREVYIRIHR